MLRHMLLTLSILAALAAPAAARAAETGARGVLEETMSAPFYAAPAKNAGAKLPAHSFTPVPDTDAEEAADASPTEKTSTGEAASAASPVESAAAPAGSVTPVSPGTGAVAPAPAALETAPVQPAAPISPAPAKSAAGESAVKKPEFSDKRIEVNLASRLLTLYQGDVAIRMYPIAPGKPSTPTPVGRRKVVDMEKNPDWTDPETETVVPSGPACPLGYRWIGIGGNYGIHGTNAPWAIGSYASHGCVRMREEDVEDLFDHIVMGIPVDIIYERVVVEETADHEVAYYIYPDGYGYEPLDVDGVRKKLDKACGAGAFADKEEIKEALWAEDGKPHYVAELYSVVLHGETLSAKAAGKDGKLVLPASTIANALSLKTEWSPNWQRFTTPLGTAPASQRGRVIYMDTADAEKVLGVTAKVDGHTVVLE